MKTRMPAIFIGHGSPMNAISHNAYTESLAAQASAMPRPAAVLVVSAHWMTPGTRVTAAPAPRQIYDFSGFPDELYRVQYAPPGDPAVAARAVGLLSAAGLHEPAADPSRGIDHAAWAVLIHMYPDASVPVLELSLDYRNHPKDFFALGAALAPLREEGILILGSGNIVHNLSAFEFDTDAPAYPWAKEFDERFKDRVARGDREALASFALPVETSKLAVPTPEHYLPALAVLGCAGEGDRLRYFHESIQNASISMRCFAVETADRV
ncbi:MAG: 4,5-DOPA dioxygenase extradiol [Rectinemataceae bacterium]